jgi:dihydrofolate reductase
MTEIIVIVCSAENNCIGKDGDIPWRIKEDFRYFKDKTLGHPCIMGDKTYISLPEKAKPLPGRENIVLTFNKDFQAKGVTVMHDFNEAIEYCKQNNEEKVFICGGATIYRLGMEVADTLMITRVHAIVDGDTFFPEIKDDEWEEVSRRDSYDDNYDYSFLVYKRR